MMHYAVTMGGRLGAGILCMLTFAVFSFIFSVIFWWTHNRMVKKRK